MAADLRPGIRNVNVGVCQMECLDVPLTNHFDIVQVLSALSISTKLKNYIHPQTTRILRYAYSGLLRLRLYKI